MPETAAPATAETATPTTSLEKAAAIIKDTPRTASGGVDVHAYAAKAQQALEAERVAMDAPNEPAAEQDSGKPAKDPKTGKFVKAGDKTSDKGAAADGGAAETTDKQAPESEPDKAEEAIPEDRDISLAAWRRKFAQDPLKAVELLAGKPVDQVAVPSKVFGAIREERRKVAARAEQVQRLVDTTIQRYSKFDAAEKAWASGDVEGAVKAAFGATVADIGKRHVARISGQNAQVTDPRIDQVLEENRLLREQMQARQQQEQQATAEQQAREQRANLQSALASSEDAGIALVASKPRFVDAVIEHLRANYDPATKTSIPVNEAAQLAYDDLYGDLPLKDATPAAPAARITAPAASKAVRTPKGRNLDTTRAAEAAPSSGPAPGSPELLRKYAALAARAALEERQPG